MSLARRSLSGSVSARGTSAVTWMSALIWSAGTPAWRATSASTGSETRRSPRRFARLYSDWKPTSSVRRSVVAERGLSIITLVAAPATWRSRAPMCGGSRVTCPATSTAASSPTRRLIATVRCRRTSPATALRLRGLRGAVAGRAAEVDEQRGVAHDAVDVEVGVHRDDHDGVGRGQDVVERLGLQAELRQGGDVGVVVAELGSAVGQQPQDLDR